MTTLTAQAPAETRSAVLRAQVALYVGAAAAVLLAALMQFTTLSETRFTMADYVFTVDAVPYFIVPIVAMAAIHALHRGRDGLLSRVGLVINTVGMLVFAPTIVYSLIVGSEESLGPSYGLATLTTFIGTALFAAGAFRAGLLPRWVAPLWAVAWIAGGPIAFGAAPGALLLAAVYVVIAVVLPRCTAKYL